MTSISTARANRRMPWLPGDGPPGTRRKTQSGNKRGFGHPLLLGLAGVAVLVTTMETVSRLGLVSEKFLPPFSSVIVATGRLLVNPGFLADLASTVTTWVIGLGLSALVAVPIGILLGLSDATYRASRTVIELIRPMPAVALIPLVILIFGQGLEMKLIIAVYAAMWPILFNAIYGVHGTDSKAKEMGESFGLSRFSIMWRIVIPSAAPFIATGIRLSSSIVLIVIITVELIAGGADGLGSFIATQRSLGNQVTLVYAGILISGLVGLAINLVLSTLERRWFGWNTTKRS